LSGHPFLETNRLVLRHFTMAALENLVELHGDPEVMRFTTGRPTPRQVIERETLPLFIEFYRRYPSYGYWAAIEKPAREFVGWFHLRPAEGKPEDELEIGYRLKRSAWGRGLATEGSIALIRKAFTELGARRVFAQTMAVHLASRRVMEKAGLKYVKTFHETWPDPIPGADNGEVEYELTREDWNPGT
jgi:RimJ/RimL family protein N-acetyltransferase